MTKFICAGTYVLIETSKGPRLGIVESTNRQAQLATVKTAVGTHVRNYKDLTIVSYKGVL